MNLLPIVAAWVGAKAGIVGDILAELMYRTGISTYCEPFSGMFNVGLKLGAYVPGLKSVYNDLNTKICVLFKLLAQPDTCAELVTRLARDTEYSAKYFNSAREICDSVDSLANGTMEQALAVWAVLLQSFNGNLERMEWKGVSKGNEVLLYEDTAARKYDLPELFGGMRLEVRNQDALELIHEFKKREDVMLYCDSPYVLDKNRGRTTSRLYEFDMSDMEQRQYAALISDAKCKIMVSGYRNDIYDNILVNGGDWNCYPLVEIAKSMTIGVAGNSKPLAYEYIYTNYPIEDVLSGGKGVTLL